MALTYATFPINKIEKLDDGTLNVKGIMTDETLDSDRQIVDAAFAAKAAPEWFDTGANVRVMHSPHLYPAGLGVELDIQDGACWLTAHVVEPNAILLVNNKVLKAFSVGISEARVILDKAAPGGRIVDGKFVEVSLVDRPANPNCWYDIVKMDKSGSMTAVDKFREMIDQIAKNEAMHKDNSGDAAPLISWYNDGADGQIDWGSPGDFDQCVSIASQYMSDDQADGFCNLRHQDAVGGPPGSEGKRANKVSNDPDVGGGVDRDQIPHEDFVFPADAPDGGFPIVTPGDVSDAVSGWGQYRGSESFQTFKDNLIAIAERKGASFVAELPQNWKDEMNQSKVTKGLEQTIAFSHDPIVKKAAMIRLRDIQKGAQVAKVTKDAGTLPATQTNDLTNQAGPQVAPVGADGQPTAPATTVTAPTTDGSQGQTAAAPAVPTDGTQDPIDGTDDATEPDGAASPVDGTTDDGDGSTMPAPALGPDGNPIPPEDYVIPGPAGEFAITQPSDIANALMQFSSYTGPVSFQDFLNSLMTIAQRMGKDFVAEIPPSLQDQANPTKNKKPRLHKSKNHKASWIIKQAHDILCPCYSTKVVKEAYPAIEKDGSAMALGPSATTMLYQLLVEEVEEDAGTGYEACDIKEIASAYDHLIHFLDSEAFEDWLDSDDFWGDLFFAAHEENHKVFKDANSTLPDLSPKDPPAPEISVSWPGINSDSEISGGGSSEVPDPDDIKETADAARVSAAAAHLASAKVTKDANGSDPSPARGKWTKEQIAGQQAKQEQLHDGLMSIFPGLCPIANDASRVGQMSRADILPDAVLDVPGSMTTMAAEPEITKSSPLPDVYFEKLIKGVREDYENKIATLEERVNKMASEPDPRQTPIRSALAVPAILKAAEKIKAQEAQEPGEDASITERRKHLEATIEWSREPSVIKAAKAELATLNKSATADIEK